jgi:hypothetical protein
MIRQANHISSPAAKALRFEALERNKLTSV